MLNAERAIYECKKILNDKINRLTIFIFIFGCIFAYGLYDNHKAILKCEKKVDFRYFNTTRSLEDIHSIKISTKDGLIIRQIAANQ